jgi:hypothetical protein
VGLRLQFRGGQCLINGRLGFAQRHAKPVAGGIRQIEEFGFADLLIYDS